MTGMLKKKEIYFEKEEEEFKAFLSKTRPFEYQKLYQNEKQDPSKSSF